MASRYYGEFGGRFSPEVLRDALVELESSWEKSKADKAFWAQMDSMGKTYIGRPTPLYRASRLEKILGRSIALYLKLEGNAHTGAHKINNAVGQALIAKSMGKTRVIAETGAGQHGLACAAAAAKLGLECEIFMGELDMARQHPNVFGMRVFGAKVTAVTEGSRTLTDAVNAALKNWTENCDTTHLIIGSVLGPHPYPDIVRSFQSVIGREIMAEIMEREGRLPSRIYACVGGGSNALGAFTAFVDNPDIALWGVEAGGRGDQPGDNAVRMSGQGKVGVVQGYRSYFLQDKNGSLLPTHSVSAGLDYAGIGPELAHLGQTGRVSFCKASDSEALNAVQVCARQEGILPALESAHALAAALRHAREPGFRDEQQLWVVNVSGRGDKDLFITAPFFDGKDWLAFLDAESSRLRKEQAP